MTIRELPIDEIIVTDRRREDMGDLAALAESIREYGLFHPVTINRDRRLVCGERRLRACALLGRTTIPAQVREELTGERLREVELEENLRRKDLTPYERSRTLADLAQLAREQAKSEPISPPMGAKVGRPVEAGSTRDVSERIGVPDTTIQKAETHVATADTYPEFKQPQWNQATVLHARKALAKLPEEDRPRAVAFVDEPGIPTTDAVGIIETLAEMPSDQREKVFVLSASQDQRDRDLAITITAKKATCPDPRVLWLKGVIREGKAWLRQFPDDPLNPRFESLIDACRSLADDTTQQHKEREENATGIDH